MGSIRLVSSWVPDTTMEHIHENHELHITRDEIKEVLQRNPRNLQIVKSKKSHKSDLNIRGRSLDGKLLHLCVIIDKKKIRNWVREHNAYDRDPDHLCSIVYNGWMISS